MQPDVLFIGQWEQLTPVKMFQVSCYKVLKLTEIVSEYNFIYILSKAYVKADLINFSNLLFCKRGHRNEVDL